MTNITLYRRNILGKGITVVLTEKAHNAFLAIAAHYQTNRTEEGMDPLLWIDVALGYFSFTLDSRYATSEVAKKVYTGGYGLLDEAMKSKRITMRCVETDHTLSLPFASGDLELFEELEAKGWGPKSERFVSLFLDA